MYGNQHCPSKTTGINNGKIDIKPIKNRKAIKNRVNTDVNFLKNKELVNNAKGQSCKQKREV